jgi:hypothetical protein
MHSLAVGRDTSACDASSSASIPLSRFVILFVDQSLVAKSPRFGDLRRAHLVPGS